jgi:hypothetical protein
MDEIIIKARNRKDEALILDLAKRLKMSVKRASNRKRKNGDKAIKSMESLAKIGGIKISDPVTWQRTSRQERSF